MEVVVEEGGANGDENIVESVTNGNRKEKGKKA
jgi:hypothetical protein